MITTAGFETYRAEAPKPEWFRAERYDFCDNANALRSTQKSKKSLFGIFKRGIKK